MTDNELRDSIARELYVSAILDKYRDVNTGTELATSVFTLVDAFMAARAKSNHDKGRNFIGKTK